MNSRSKARWFFIIPPILLFWIFGQMDKLGISVVVTNHALKQAMGLVGKPEKIGLLMTGFTILYGFSNLVWGFIVDRIGPRRAAIIGVTIWGLTMILGGLSASYGQLMASRMILGIGEGIMFPVSSKFVANRFVPKEYGRAQAAWIAGDYLGPALGVPLIVAVIAMGGWRASFYLLAAFSILILLPMFTFLTRDLPEQHGRIGRAEREYIRQGQETEQASDDKGIGQVLSNYRYWMVWAARFVDAILFYGLSFWLPTYLEKSRHFSAAVMSSWTSLAWLMALISVLLCGYIADKIKRPALIGGIVFAVGTVALFIVLHTGSASLAAAMMGVSLAAVGGVLEISQLLLLNYSGPKNSGAAAGLMGFNNLFGGFTVAFIGYLVKNAGGSFTPAISFLLIVAIVGVVVFLAIIPTERRQHVNSHLSA